LSEPGFTGFPDFQDLETIEKNEVFSLDYRFDDALHKRYVSIKKHINPGNPIILKILVQTFVGFRELNPTYDYIGFTKLSYRRALGYSSQLSGAILR
jgi:hypothetical protein